MSNTGTQFSYNMFMCICMHVMAALYVPVYMSTCYVQYKCIYLQICVFLEVLLGFYITKIYVDLGLAIE